MASGCLFQSVTNISHTNGWIHLDFIMFTCDLFRELMQQTGQHLLDVETLVCDLSYTITIIRSVAIYSSTVLSAQDTVDYERNG